MAKTQNSIIFSLFLIFTEVVLSATVALYARQVLPIAITADSLEPLRDFLLVLFFSLGAVLLPTLLLGGLLMVVKPWVFRGFYNGRENGRALP